MGGCRGPLSCLATLELSTKKRAAPPSWGVCPAPLDSAGWGQGLGAVKVGGASLPTLAPGGFETKSAPEGRRLLKLYSAYRSRHLLKMQVVSQQVWEGLQMLLVLDHALNGKGSRDRRAHSGRREDLGGGGGEFRWEPEFVVAKAGHIWQTSLLGTVDDLTLHIGTLLSSCRMRVEAGVSAYLPPVDLHWNFQPRGGI